MKVKTLMQVLEELPKDAVIQFQTQIHRIYTRDKPYSFDRVEISQTVHAWNSKENELPTKVEIEKEKPVCTIFVE
jgi:hypothetical protein